MTGQDDLFPPIARDTDPETSHRAARLHTLTGKRAKRMRQVLALVVQYPGHTAHEYGNLMIKAYPDLPVLTCITTPHKRLSDLRQLGLVEKIGRKTCSKSGQLCWYYNPTMAGVKSI